MVYQDMVELVFSNVSNFRLNLPLQLVQISRTCSKHSALSNMPIEKNPVDLNPDCGVAIMDTK